MGDGYANYPPWTQEKYAFESFEHPEYGAETILRIEVMAFSSSLTCERLDYTSVYDNDGPNSTVTMQADRSSLDKAGCLGDVAQMVKQPYNTSTVASYFEPAPGSLYNADTVVPPAAWLNVTECGPSQDHRLLANVMTTDLSVTESANTTVPSDVKIRVTGLICEPQYYLVPATVQINATTAKVMDFNITESKKTPVDIGTSTLIMQAQMEGPYERMSRLVFQAAATNQWSSTELPNSYDWAVFPQLEIMQRWSWLYLWNSTSTRVPAVDPFFQGLVNLDPNSVLELFHDPDRLYAEVNEQFARKVALIAHIFGRRPQSGHFNATESFQGSRIFVRESSLRLIQAVLILLGAMTLLCATRIRPKTCLIEDPGSIASISVLLSANPTFESFVSSKRLQNDSTSTCEFQNILCRLRQPTAGVPALEFSYQHRGGDTSCLDITGSALPHTPGKPSEHASSKVRIQPCPRRWLRSSHASRELVAESRYRPMALRTYSRAALLFCVVGMVITLAALLVASKSSNGFQAATQTLQAAWSYTPTFILVLVGYGIQSLETSVSTLEKYWTLASNGRPGHSVVLPHSNPIES